MKSGGSARPGGGVPSVRRPRWPHWLWWHQQVGAVRSGHYGWMQSLSAGSGDGAQRQQSRLKCQAAPGIAQGMGLSLLLRLWSQDGQEEPGLQPGLGESRGGGWSL